VPTEANSISITAFLELSMDNHHPKGPHIHIDDQELPYEFMNEKQLISDFK
jgi:hypothetical protein